MGYILQCTLQQISQYELENQEAQTDTGCDLLTHAGRVHLVHVVLPERVLHEQTQQVLAMKTRQSVERKSTDKVRTIFERLLEEVSTILTTTQSAAIDSFYGAYRFLKTSRSKI